MTTARTYLPESQMGPAERLLDVVLGSSAHLWHNRPGIDRDGTWVPAKGQTKNVRGKRVQPPVVGRGDQVQRAPVQPGDDE